MTTKRSTSFLGQLMSWMIILTALMSLTLATLKLAGISDISWWTAFTPLLFASIVYFGVILLLLLLAGIFHAIGIALDRRESAAAERESAERRRKVVDAMNGRAAK